VSVRSCRLPMCWKCVIGKATSPFAQVFLTACGVWWADDYVDDSEMLGHHAHSLKLPFDKLYSSFAANLHSEEVSFVDNLRPPSFIYWIIVKFIRLSPAISSEGWAEGAPY
jgi:hypothetical protein